MSLHAPRHRHTLRSLRDLDPSWSVPYTPPAPPAVHVVSVTQDLTGVHAVWTFDAAVASVSGDARCLQVDGDSANDGAVKTGSNQVTTNYTDGISPGEAWSVDPALGGVTFVNGGTLGAQSGTIS